MSDNRPNIVLELLDAHKRIFKRILTKHAVGNDEIFEVIMNFAAVLKAMSIASTIEGSIETCYALSDSIERQTKHLIKLNYTPIIKNKGVIQ